MKKNPSIRLLVAVLAMVVSPATHANDYSFNPGDWSVDIRGEHPLGGVDWDYDYINAPQGFPIFYSLHGTHLKVSNDQCSGQAFGAVGDLPAVCLKYVVGMNRPHPAYAEYNKNIRTVMNIYHGSEWYASAYVILSDRYAGNAANMFKNTVVISDGLDFGRNGNRHIDDLICSDEYKTLLKKNGNTPLGMGYNLIFVDYVKGAGDLKMNAKAFAKVLEFLHINSTPETRVAVAGFSMGGVIARLALMYLENRDPDYMVKFTKLISIDAPHRGAAVSSDLQGAIEELVVDWGAKDQRLRDAYNDLDEPASKQLLYDNVRRTGNERTEFLRFLRVMGDYPINVKRYAIAEGKWDEPYTNYTALTGATITVNDTTWDIELRNHELAPGSYREDLQDKDITFDINLFGIKIKIGEVEVGTYGGNRIQPTHIPIYSALDIRGMDTKDWADVTAQWHMEEVCRYHTPFDRIYLTDPYTRRKHITFDDKLNTTIVDILGDNEDFGGPLVRLQARDGQYFCAEGAGGKDVNATRTWSRAWETFRLVDLNGWPLRDMDIIALQASNNSWYASCDGGGGGGFRADKREMITDNLLIWRRWSGTGIARHSEPVSLQCYDEPYFVVAEGGGGGEVNANRKEASSWERFTYTGGNEYLVNLRTNNGKWVVAERGGGSVVNANRDRVAQWETFVLVDRNGGSLLHEDEVNFRTSNGHSYMVAEHGGGARMLANRAVPLAWETFTIRKKSGSGEIHSGDEITLQGANGHYVVAEGGGGYELNANRSAAKAWETFTIYY